MAQMTDAAERLAAMLLVFSNSSLKKELARDKKPERINALLDEARVTTPGVRQVVHGLTADTAALNSILVGGDELHAAFFSDYTDACPPDGWAGEVVAALTALDTNRSVHYPKFDLPT